MAVNVITLVGRLVKEPNDSRITNIAVDGGKDKNGNERVDFIPLYFNKAFDNVMPYLTKGKLIGVVGSLHSYKNKDNHTKLMVIVRSVELLGGGNGKKKEEGTSEPEIGDDDVPWE